MSLIDRIRVLCAEHGETIASLERKLDLGNGTIKRWESAQPTADRLAKAADFFGVSVDYLLGRESAAAPNELENVYLNFMKKAQSEGIAPADIELAIKTIQEIRSAERNDTKNSD